jgi:hypothetical protein
LLTEAQAAAGWGVIVVLGALLGAIYLNQASKIATIGRRVQMEQNELDEVKRANAELERQIAEAQSLERLDAEARRLGFVPSTPADIDYVVIPQYPTGERRPVGDRRGQRARRRKPRPRRRKRCGKRWPWPSATWAST